mmetsp:Transcript_313/g.560  ORF Transcript_313/g.560 Transcript_313/m.560 type:complete len:126 (-) Transcript_313:851-1228(-)
MVMGKTPVNKKKKNWNRINKVKARNIKKRKRAEQKRKDATEKDVAIGGNTVATGLMDVELTLQDKEKLALKAVESRLKNRKPRGLSKKKTKAVLKQVRLRAKENALSTDSQTAKSKSKGDIMMEV